MVTNATACETLGLRPGAPRHQVTAAYKRLALQWHPDKPGGSAEAFQRVHAAFVHMSHELEGDHRCIRTENVEAIIRWFFMAYTAAISGSCQAEDVCIDVDVTLDDIYFSRVKKIVIGVMRWNVVKACLSRVQQEVFVVLGKRREEHVFRGSGDDPPLLWLMLLRAVKGTFVGRGDVVVRVKVKPHQVYQIDEVFSVYDIYSDVDVSPMDHYYGRDVVLSHFESPDVTARYTSGRRVHVERGRGLPVASGGRGDLFVYFNLKLPPLTEGHLRLDSVRSAFKHAFVCDREEPECRLGE